MTLTTRLLLFYLSSLIGLLAGFSTAIYILAKVHLQRQSDERLEAALNTLNAAIEIGPDGVEWEPNEHTPLMVSRAARDRIAWLVTDGGGRVVARSEQPESDDLLKEALGRLHDSSSGQRRLHWRGERWQAGQRRVIPSGSTEVTQEHKAINPKEIKYSELIITTALPLEPTRATLHELAAALTGVSFGVLAVALLVGRAVCRRALRPLQRMAADARAVDPADSDRRLATPSGGDELTELGHAFNGLLDRLHESLERQRRFTGDASHQLRTPLAALLGQIEIALRRERTPDEYRQALTTAQSKASHLQQLIESLLYLTRSDADAAVPHRERLDLAACLAEHVSTWKDHPRFKDIQVAGLENPAPVICHPVLFGEIINILLDNACQYSPPGSTIILSVVQAEETVRIEITDRGLGIAEDDLPKVFSPFFRATSALKANKSGVGLGLSIARRLAESLGGSLIATSRVGVGSCFVVTFPTAKEY